MSQRDLETNTTQSDASVHSSDEEEDDIAEVSRDGSATEDDHVVEVQRDNVDNENVSEIGVRSSSHTQSQDDNAVEVRRHNVDNDNVSVISVRSSSHTQSQVQLITEDDLMNDFPDYDNDDDDVIDDYAGQAADPLIDNGTKLPNFQLEWDQVYGNLPDVRTQDPHNKDYYFNNHEFYGQQKVWPTWYELPNFGRITEDLIKGVDWTPELVKCIKTRLYEQIKQYFTKKPHPTIYTIVFTTFNFAYPRMAGKPICSRPRKIARETQESKVLREKRHLDLNRNGYGPLAKALQDMWKNISYKEGKSNVFSSDVVSDASNSETEVTEEGEEEAIGLAPRAKTQPKKTQPKTTSPTETSLKRRQRTQGGKKYKYPKTNASDWRSTLFVTVMDQKANPDDYFEWFWTENRPKDVNSWVQSQFYMYMKRNHLGWVGNDHTPSHLVNNYRKGVDKFYKHLCDDKTTHQMLFQTQFDGKYIRTAKTFPILSLPTLRLIVYLENQFPNTQRLFYTKEEYETTQKRTAFVTQDDACVKGQGTVYFDHVAIITCFPDLALFYLFALHWIFNKPYGEELCDLMCTVESVIMGWTYTACSDEWVAAKIKKWSKATLMASLNKSLTSQSH